MGTVPYSHLDLSNRDSQVQLTAALESLRQELELRADFPLNNRSNMRSPVLIGRTTSKEVGGVDPGRAYLADQKIMR